MADSIPHAAPRQMIKSRNFMESILRHLSTYSILELLLKIVSEVEEASGRGDDFDWLYEFGIIGKLLEKINKDYGEDLHANASAALVGFISCQGSPMIFQSSIPSGQSRFVKVTSFLSYTSRLVYDADIFSASVPMLDAARPGCIPQVNCFQLRASLLHTC